MIPQTREERKRFYPNHAKRYAQFSEDERQYYPDEVYKWGWGWIKRIHDFCDLTQEEWDTYGADLIEWAAKDIPIYRAARYP